MTASGPVPQDELCLVAIEHLGIDGERREGEMMVHVSLADEVREIFDELLRARFPIQRVRLIDRYAGDDLRSMEDDNTSAYACREITLLPGVWSMHAYGRAIDVNPLRNPYKKGEIVLPPAGARFLDRSLGEPGIIVPGDACHTAFVRRGWVWGGDWKDRVDYQHFEKPFLDASRTR